MLISILLLLLWIACIAHVMRFRQTAWLVATLLFGPLALLLYVLAIPRVEREEQRRRAFERKRARRERELRSKVIDLEDEVRRLRSSS
jgi:membrane protein implicated in regulation of membrane protease activity